MRVTRLPRDPGPAGWNAILPERTLTPRLEEAVSADWLIIGAGFAGLSAARRLTQLRPQDRIVILEARTVADGPAGRNSGFMIDLPHDLASEDYGGAVEADRAQTRANRAAIAFAAQAAEEYAMPSEALVRSGKTNAAASEKGLAHNRDYGAHLAKLGEAHEFLDAAQMQEMCGTGYYRGGLYTPGTAMLQPAIYIRSLAEGVMRGGVVLHERSPVLSLEHQGTWLAQTPLGRVSAPRVILAVNGHAESFGQFRGRLMHVFTYASLTRALSAEEAATLGGAPTWGVTPADPMGTTVRRISGQGGDRIVIRNRFTFDPSMEVPDRRIARVAVDHDKAFAARFPMLAGVEMSHRWGGRLCLSRNNVAAFGEVAEGVFSACCQNGLGTAKGTLHGMLAAEMACGEGSEMLDQVLSAPAPQRLPPKPIAWLGANAVMRWGEFKAGSEL